MAQTAEPARVDTTGVLSTLEDAQLVLIADAAQRLRGLRESVELFERPLRLDVARGDDGDEDGHATQAFALSCATGPRVLVRGDNCWVIAVYWISPKAHDWDEPEPFYSPTIYPGSR